MKNSAHIGFWMTIVVVGFLLNPLFRAGPSMERFLRQEITETRSALGDETTLRVIGFANLVFEDTPLHAIAELSNAAKTSNEDRTLTRSVAGAGGLVMVNLANSYLQGLMLESFVVAMRFAIAVVWLAILAPFLIAAIFDGFMQRKIKRAEFGAIRPATFTIAGMVVIPMMAAPLVYLVSPLSLSPLLAPVWAFLVALPLGLMISNMQPIFGR